MRRHNHNRATRRRLLRLLSLLTVLPFFPNAIAARRHHTAEGTFRNTNGSAISKPFSDLMKWRREAPEVQPVDFALAKNEPARLRENRSDTTLTWIGHATLLLQCNGVNILTDPQFSDRASPFQFTGPKRATAPGLALADLPPIDLVLISHSHYDHLDSASVAAIAEQHNPHFIVPLKLGALVADMGAKRITELDWGEAHDDGALRITAEPCHHWSARGLFDRNKTLWASFVIEVNNKTAAAPFRFLFIGDTGYSADFTMLGEKYGGFDLAAIPIGAYAPRWFMKEAHINPTESVQIFQDLRAKEAVATHWGVFPLTNEPMDEPPQKLRQALADAGIADNVFNVMQHGESRWLHTAG